MSAFQSLDPPTLLLAIAVFSSVLAALTLNLDRAMPDHAAELKRWGLAMLCSSAAFIGYFLRGHAPTWLTFVGANLAALGCPALGLVAHAHYRGARLPRKAIGLVLAGGFAGPLTTHLLDIPQRWAVASMSLAAVTLFWSMAWVAIQPRGVVARNAGAWLSFVAAAGLGAVMMVRLLLVVLGSDSLPMQSNAVPQLVTLFGGALFVVAGTLGFVLMVSEGQRLRALEHARRDGLTGLLTRSAFMQAGAQHLVESRAAVLLMLDLDHFKAVNDRHGHAAGDLVLLHAARLVASRCRPIDLVGRYGGEEFCILLRDTDEHTGAQFAERLVREVRRSSVRLPHGECRYTLSVGFTARPAHATGPALSELFDQADRALYAAKHEGRDRAVAASRSLAVAAPRSMKTAAAVG